MATTTWSMVQQTGRVGRKDKEQAVFVTVAETSSNSRGVIHHHLVNSAHYYNGLHPNYPHPRHKLKSERKEKTIL